jgi:DNA polymerase III delta subunit
MKVTILSGNDHQALWLRKKQIIKAISARGWENQIVTSDTSVAEQLRSTSLFENQKLFIIEDLKIFTDKNIAWFKNNLDFEANLLIVCEDTVPVKIKNVFGKKANIEIFDLPKKIFVFLESIFPGNAKNCLNLLHDIIKNDPIELVFALISSQARDLYWVKMDPGSYNLPFWRLDKLKRQSQKFTQEGLEGLIKNLAKIDMEAKTSKSQLTQSLDLVLLTSLK